ncbi:quinone-dependent dihydroorotate dehydrogenase [bacterium]|nr:quinone-dependent dihydroorotate dehydrogenase [bacterium]
MTGFYRTFLRPILFSQDSEAIHDRTMSGLGFCARHRLLTDAVASFFAAPAMPVDLFGLRFPNPVGLAAGMDKKAAAVPVWEALGFGHVELGGVTLHEQPGNPAPRMFRAIADEALVNRMGFNNPGAEAMAQKLASWKSAGLWPKHPVGMNLGKSKITPLEEAASDYVGSFKRLREFVDFFVVNVSSPNTPNLRQLQDKAALNEILAALQEENGTKNQKPILVKIAPDLSFEAIDEILELVGPRNLAGIVATNTTIARPETNDARAQKTYAETGGLSGKPLRQRSTECIRHIYRQTSGRVPIIGVGGIFNADDAWEKISAGASLVQIYTGLVYEGPGITSAIVNGLRERLDHAGLKTIGDAVGISH